MEISAGGRFRARQKPPAPGILIEKQGAAAEIERMRRSARIVILLLAPASLSLADPTYTVEEAVAVAKKQNIEIAIASKQVDAARGGVIEARSGFLPSVVSTGLLRRRERQEASRLRPEDYDASVRVVQSLYTGGAVTSQLAIARLIHDKRVLEYQALVNRVSMDVRLAFYELLLNKAKIHVREQSVQVFQEELKTQRQRFETGTVGALNVSRAEVALANEQPELIDAQTQVQNSYLKLGQLLGMDARANSTAFEAAGSLEYSPRHPDLNECLAYADVNRPEIKAREIAKGNLGAGLGTQLDILQAASDVTRTRTTRLGAIYLHNVALARLARACAREPQALDFSAKTKSDSSGKPIAEVVVPPSTLGGAR